MAYAVIGGLAVATALTLVFLPSLYVAWFRVKYPGDHASVVNSTLPKAETTEASRSATQPALAHDASFMATQ